MNSIRLQKNVQFNFGRKISNRPDCEELSRHIFKKTNRMISYNTLRRFFGISENKSKTISKSSLDILSIYSEFSDFSEFCLHEEPMEDLSNLFKNYSDLINQKSFTLDSVELMLKSLTNTREIFGVSNFIIENAFHNGDLNFLKQLFKVKQVFNGDYHARPLIYFLVQNIGEKINSYPKLAPELWQSWAKYKEGRMYYFELFVDLNNMNTSHYMGIEYYLKHSSTPQDLMFANSLLTWRFLLLEDLESAKKQIATIQKIKNLEKLHPLAITQFLNCKLLLDFYENKNVSKSLLEEIAIWRMKDSFIPNYEFFICDGLIITGNYELALAIIESTENKIDETHFSTGLLEKMKIFKCYCLLKVGKETEAMVLYKKINLDKLEVCSKEYDSLFYYAIEKETCPTEVRNTIHQKKYDLLFNKL